MLDEIHDQRIDDRILAEIRTARAIVVDSSGANPNVMFEAGVALGRTATIIGTCRDDHAKNLERTFDIRQYRHIVWRPGNLSAAAQEVRDSIRQLVGQGPLR